MLSDESVARIDVFYSVAKLNDSALKLSDLSLLLNSEASLEQLEDAFARYPYLSAKYQLRSGFIFEKGAESPVQAEFEKNAQAQTNRTIASGLSRRLKRRECSIIAVSGSTSYNSVKRSDDLDLFCVTSNDSAWIFYTKALLLLRASRIFSPGLSRANVSCVMDSRFASELFGREQDALFARDGLNAVVLEGAAEYGRLLSRSSWMTKFFPRLYANRIGKANVVIGSKRPSILSRLANRFLFVTVGSYVRTKSMLENRRIAKRRIAQNQFVTLLGPDHCIFESYRYRRMRLMYAQMHPESRGTVSPARAAGR
jgi:hypothetical protein